MPCSVATPRAPLFALLEEYDTRAGPTAFKLVAVFTEAEAARRAMAKRVAADALAVDAARMGELAAVGYEFATYDSPDRVRYALSVGWERFACGYQIEPCVLDPEEI